MKYYIVENKQAVGPFEVEELVARSIKPTDLVWCEGMSQWTPVSEVAEIMDVMNAGSQTVPPVVPPVAGGVQPPVCNVRQQVPYYPEPGQEAIPPMPNTWLIASILATLFCCVPLGLVGVVKAARVETLWRAGKYEEAGQTSAEARKWTIITLICGIIILVLYYMFIGAVIASLSNVSA